MPNVMHKTTSKADSTFIVIGYGNPQQGDDAIGQKVIQQLQALHLPNVETCTVHQLTPELSGKLATCDFAIFVDACRFDSADTVSIKPLEAFGCETPGSTIPAFGHSCHPAALLALTHSVYGYAPKSWWIEVPATDFTFGHTLSDLAQQGVDQTLHTVQQLIRSTA